MKRAFLGGLSRSLCGVAAVVVCMAGSLSALEPPTAQQIKEYKARGVWDQRVAAARALGNDRVNPELAARARQRVRVEAAKAAGMPAPADLDEISELAPPPNWGSSLPTTGTVKILVILIDFSDYPHGANQTVADVESKYFGSGNAARFPYDSLHNYYQRSSYNQLDVQGTVLGWYRAAHERNYYRDLDDTAGVGREPLIKEVLAYYNDPANGGHDFTQYDNNNDGRLDGFYVKWTGPIGDWATFWWAYVTGWGDSSYRIDGKSLGGYTWSWIAGSTSELYDPQVDIHETGHMLGVPDYYDYNGDVGPDGGVGGLDIMDGNWGDHNCFSKFLLGWLTPTFIVGGSSTLNLRPTGNSQDAVLIMPNAMYTPGTWFDEYYMAQYRSRSAGNDSNFPTGSDGMMIWHVDSTGYFSYDNSYTAHKLLRLMEADGEEDIEANRGGDAGDFYHAPKTFGTNTVPNSRTYSGLSTGILISQLGSPGATMSAQFSVADEPRWAGSFSVVTEDCHPANQKVDPDERVTINLTLANIGTVTTSNLTATLLATGGVTSPTGAQNYGVTTPGGDLVTRQFSFTAAGTCGDILTLTVQLQDGASSFPPVVMQVRLGNTPMDLDETLDTLTAPAVPNGWSINVASGSATAWATTTVAADSAPNAFFAAAPSSASDNRLDSPVFTVTSAAPQLTFRHRYQFNSRSDGGVLEISINGGAFTDIITAGGSFVTGAYINTITSTSNPIRNRNSWTGTSSNFITTTVNLPAAASGQPCQLRWRLGSNSTSASPGWYVDSIALPGVPAVCATHSIGDFDGDGDVDQEDFGRFQACMTASGVLQNAPACLPAMLDSDMDVDQADLVIFVRCHTQAGVAANPDCRNP